MNRQLPSKTVSCECLILGAGPAGLGAAYELAQKGVKDVIVVDRNAKVGGLARTEQLGGAHFDIGPHRFYTKNSEILALWRKLLGNDFRQVNRLTRIYYKDKFFSYPLKPFEALLKLGAKESTQAISSYMQAKFKRYSNAITFEDWIVQRFGDKLYQTFFKTYTEKVWGIPGSQIGAEWAAQRIKGLDVRQVLKHAFSGNSGAKTLVEQFDYPTHGSGQMYEAMAEAVTKLAARMLLETRVVKINLLGDKVLSVDVKNDKGELFRIEPGQVFTSVPITHFFKLLEPAPESKILSAVDSLYYRDHITVNLLIDKTNLFPDQWIYVHAPEVKAARIANYNNFSTAMSGSPNRTAISLEYFAFQNEPFWQITDSEIAKFALDELERMKLAPKNSIIGSWVVRETESYPTYYLGYRPHLEVLQKALKSFRNVMPIGRGALFRYNNQDHSTLSGMLAARHFINPHDEYDAWSVNEEQEYLESGKRS